MEFRCLRAHIRQMDQEWVRDGLGGGRYSSREGLQQDMQCDACPKGSFCSTGSLNYTLCSPGTIITHAPSGALVAAPSIHHSQHQQQARAPPRHLRSAAQGPAHHIHACQGEREGKV